MRKKFELKSETRRPLAIQVGHGLTLSALISRCISRGSAPEALPIFLFDCRKFDFGYT